MYRQVDINKRKWLVRTLITYDNDIECVNPHFSLYLFQVMWKIQAIRP